MHAGGGLFADAMDAVEHLWVFFVNNQRQVAAIVQQHVRIPRFAVRKDGLFNTPLVLFFGFSFPSKNRHTASCHGCCRMILGGEDVAR